MTCLNLLERLEEIAHDEGLTISKANLDSVEGLLYNKIILIKDKSDIRKSCAILAEELGHYYTGGGNSAQSTDSSHVRRCEYRAMKKAVELTLNQEQVISMLSGGYRVDEVAELFDVPDEFMLDALRIWGYAT